MKKKRILGIVTFSLALCLLITGCGDKNATLEDNHTVVSTDEGEISADTLYASLRDKYGISVLVDLIDHQILDSKYETDETETETVNSQIEQMKSQYDDDEAFLTVIKKYFGVSSEDELRDMLSLEYKRNLAIEDYVESTIADDEINKYYDDEVVGDMKVRHILIKPDTNSDMSTEETTEAEEKAKEEAEEIIKKLDDGEDFASLAEEYSDDTGSASDGGLIDYFNKDDNMDEAFLNASIELEVGKYTEEPVKSSYGYHIILKEDQKDKPELEEVEDDIRETLAEEKLNDDATLVYNALIEIRKNAGIEFKDDSLKRDYDELMEQLIENASSSNA